MRNETLGVPKLRGSSIGTLRPVLCENLRLEKVLDKIRDFVHKGKLTGTLTVRLHLRDGGVGNAEQEWRSNVDLD